MRIIIGPLGRRGDRRIRHTLRIRRKFATRRIGG